jgi:hypothetical protein
MEAGMREGGGGGQHADFLQKDKPKISKEDNQDIWTLMGKKVKLSLCLTN